MDAMFEQASRIRLRFGTTQGLLTIEEVWGLPLTSTSGRASLDDLAKDLNRAVKDAAEESFVVVASKASAELELAFEIVKHVIKTRMAENEAKATAVANREKKQRLLALIEEKQNDELKIKSKEELMELVGSL